MSVRDIHIEDYDYNLPEERIAKYPLPERDASRLLVRKEGRISSSVFNRIGDFIPDDSLLVFNNTRVIQARMIFHKETGAQIEIFCLEPRDPSDYALAFSRNSSCDWLCLIGNVRRWKGGKLACEVAGGRCTVERIESYGETHLVRFEWDNPGMTFADILEQCGELPIPPYLKRKTEERDKETYQTVYSRIDGSVAAPTAGLHFTEKVLDSLRKKGVLTEELTLHVGAGTFKPVKSESISGHEMHTEAISVKRSTVEQLIRMEGRIFAVGTTSVRTLESLYHIGRMLGEHPGATADQLVVDQWDPYISGQTEPSARESLTNILDWLDRNKLDVFTTSTRILIAPGYRFRVVNAIITNFHQPKSTLLLLVSAFVGGGWKEIYDYAMDNEFRFLSYGDSSLLM